MSTQHNFEQMSLNDIIFEERNKAYGAYQLRMEYAQNMRTAILLTFGLLTTVSLFQFLYGFFHKTPPILHEEIIVSTTELYIPKVDKIVEKVKPPKGSISPPTIKNTTMQIVENTRQLKDSVPFQEQMLAMNAGSVTNLHSGDVKGDPAVFSPIPSEPIDPPKPPKIEKPIIFEIVEEMPEFPGGQEALFKYISENMEYPTVARDNDVQGKVVVSFVVKENGDIDAVKIARGVNKYLDNEAKRVISSMPKWKAGRQQGKNVMVSFMVPIVFKLN